MNLLIVDDLPTNRKLLRVTFEAEGHLTLEAADGIEALAVLARETVEAVISDVLMPNMDGFRLCREIRKNDLFAALPFIIYTSTYTSPEDIELSRTVGADKYVIRPAPAAVLVDALREAIEVSAARRLKPGRTVEEAEVLKQYSHALVTKLESKNGELQQAHARILKLNFELERRVKERTAELEKANNDLRDSLANVKELSGLLPICSYCKKIRDDKNYWQSVEGYISHHSKAHFTHGICPECAKVILNKEFGNAPEIIARGKEGRPAGT